MNSSVERNLRSVEKHGENIVSAYVDFAKSAKESKVADGSCFSKTPSNYYCRGGTFQNNFYNIPVIKYNKK